MDREDIDTVIEEVARDAEAEADKIAAEEAAKTAAEDAAKGPAGEAGKGSVITHKYRGSQQFSRVEYSTQIY